MRTITNFSAIVATALLIPTAGAVAAAEHRQVHTVRSYHDPTTFTPRIHDTTPDLPSRTLGREATPDLPSRHPEGPINVSD